MSNLVTRTLSGLIFLIVLIGCIIAGSVSYGILLMFIILMGIREFSNILGSEATTASKSFTYISAISIFVTSFLYGLELVPAALVYISIVPIIFIFIAELYSKSEHPFRNIGINITSLIYLAVPFSLLNTVSLDGLGNYEHRIILSMFIFLWANDVGAYCFGMLLGRSGKHKLFERISPKKSWEGFWGGLVSALLFALILSYTFKGLFFNDIHWYILALIIAIFGVFGDLIESMLKRSVNIKDSGNIIPGHGGILDRFDGALISFPCAVAYLQLIGLF